MSDLLIMFVGILAFLAFVVYLTNRYRWNDGTPTDQGSRWPDQ